VAPQTDAQGMTAQGIVPLCRNSRDGTWPGRHSSSKLPVLPAGPPRQRRCRAASMP